MSEEFAIKEQVMQWLVPLIVRDQSPDPDVIYPRVLGRPKTSVAGEHTNIFVGEDVCMFSSNRRSRVRPESS